jgi:hypothetical protein
MVTVAGGSTVSAGLRRSTPVTIDAVGFRFYLALAGAALGIGVLLWIVLLVFWRAVYAWGFLGAFVALAALLLLIGWIVDRREARIREG